MTDKEKYFLFMMVVFLVFAIIFAVICIYECVAYNITADEISECLVSYRQEMIKTISVNVRLATASMLSSILLLCSSIIPVFLYTQYRNFRLRLNNPDYNQIDDEDDEEDKEEE